MKLLYFSFLAALLLSCTNTQHTKIQPSYMTADDPMCALWEAYQYTDEETEIRYQKYYVNNDALDYSAFSFVQEYLFFIPGDSGESMISPFEIDGAFACPSYFNAKKDNTHLYFEVISTCELSRTPEELKKKVAYKFDAETEQLTLIEGGIPYDYVHWEP